MIEMTYMTFAPGWSQTIDTGGPDERQDLLSYISDTHKAIYGIRPRGETAQMTIDDLRAEATFLEDEIIDQIKRETEYNKRRAERERREKAAHKAAMKFYTNLKPRNNAMQLAFMDAMDS